MLPQVKHQQSPVLFLFGFAVCCSAWFAPSPIFTFLEFCERAHPVLGFSAPRFFFVHTTGKITDHLKAMLEAGL